MKELQPICFYSLVAIFEIISFKKIKSLKMNIKELSYSHLKFWAAILVKRYYLYIHSADSLTHRGWLACGVSLVTMLPK